MSNLVKRVTVETLHLWIRQFKDANDGHYPRITDSVTAGFPVVYYIRQSNNVIIDWLSDNLHIDEYTHYHYMTTGAIVFSTVADSILFKLMFPDDTQIEMKLP